MPFPDAARETWRAWCDLSDSRQGGFGIGPLTFAEIESYMRTTGVPLRPWEVRALHKVDRVFRQAMA